MGVRTIAAIIEPVISVDGLVILPLEMWIITNMRPVIQYNIPLTSCNTLTLSDPMLMTSPSIW